MGKTTEVVAEKISLLMGRAKPYSVLSMVGLVVMLQGLVFLLSGRSFITQGPGAEIYQVAKALWHEGGFPFGRYDDLFRKVQNLSLTQGADYWQDVFAMGIDGRLYPKHCLLLAVLSAPFIGVFGEFGAWVFEQLMLLLLVVSSFRIFKTILGESSAGVATLILMCGTQTLLYSYVYSYDVLAASLFIAAFAWINKIPFGAGLLAGLVVFVRPTHALLLPFVFYVIGEVNRSRAFAGMMLSCIAFGLCNYLIWGSPFLSSYDRVVFFKAGEALITNWPHYEFSWSIFRSDWGLKLFGRGCGLLLWNPVVLFAPFVFCFKLTPAQIRFFAVCSLAALSQILMVFSYGHWSASSAGNRFLFIPVILLGFAGVFVLLKVPQLWQRIRAPGSGFSF